MKPLLLLFFGMLSAPVWAQFRMEGIVRDTAGSPLPFATVVANNGELPGAFSDIDGYFVLNTPREPDSVAVRYVGYASVVVFPDTWRNGGTIEIVLKATDYALPEAEVIAGENPADLLMRKVVARRKRNNPENRDAYQCHTYNKIAFEFLPGREAFEERLRDKDTSRQWIKDEVTQFNRIEKDMQKQYLFLMETVTERSYRRPSEVQEKVMLNRVSGVDNSSLVALANAIQPFTFYSDYIPVLDKQFVNPVSPGSENLYFFHLEDTLFVGKDTIWAVSFHPRKGKVFTGLEGVMHIHSDGYAIRDVRARPAEKANLDLRLEQSYEKVDDQWFPRQLNFEMILEKYPSPHIGLKAGGRSYITEAKIDPDLPGSLFNPEQPIAMEEEAGNQPDSAWTAWRQLAPLSLREQETYRVLDQPANKSKTSRAFNLMDYLASGRAPIVGQLNASLNHLLRFNQYEGVRIGFGLTNAPYNLLFKPRRFEWLVWAGYGLRDSTFKYGLEGKWRLGPRRQTAIGFILKSDDLQEPGVLYDLSPPAFVNRSLYASRMDRNEGLELYFSARPWKGASVKAMLRNMVVYPGYPYEFFPPRDSAGLSIAEAGIVFRYAYDEKVNTFFGRTAGGISRWPVLEAAYHRGLDDAWGGRYAYQRWSLAVYQSVFIRRLGRTDWRLEAGVVTGDAPLSRMFTLNQSPDNGNWGLFVVRNTFQSLPDTLFASDRFVNFYLTQEVGPILYSAKHSAPFLILHHHTAWGDLQQPERHRLIGLRTNRQPLQESGIQIDNILRFNYVNFAYLGLGGAVFYRWGGLQQPDNPAANFSYRLSLRFTM